MLSVVPMFVGMNRPVFVKVNVDVRSVLNRTTYPPRKVNQSECKEQPSGNAAPPGFKLLHFKHSKAERRPQ
jgi:hypothetical protein